MSIAQLPSADALMDEARREAGLADFGDDCFLEPFRRLVLALNTEARLNALGAKTFHERIRNILLTRLRAQDWFRRHPEILEEEINAPVAIVAGPVTPNDNRREMRMTPPPGTPPVTRPNMAPAP